LGLDLTIVAKVLITGGTGLIGSRLGKQLLSRGYEVVVLSRTKSAESPVKTCFWNPSKSKIPAEALDSVDFIIHLAGAGLADKRWTSARKREIVDSRVLPAGLLFEAIKERNIKPGAVISASGIAYYGTITSEKIFEEGDAAASDFLGSTCFRWEQAIDRFESLGIRTVKLRTAVVLSSRGGALPKMLLPLRLGFGSALGSGRQYLPWIHVDDLCAIYLKAIEDNEMRGAYNAVAPEHISYRHLINQAAKLQNKKLWFPDVPAWFLRLLLGEMSGMLLKGSRVSSSKIQAAGFDFAYPALSTALHQLFMNRK